ncbi:uncharacterized protein LOC142583687 [Dermacentor variabilis]|uniref:uncharacterized protein LOC142583687 n=1 Tax=Dermacentor variabilis TaxID=34621 RepID=UPI003F5B1C3F
MERMLLRRLQKHLEETDQVPETMYGFRQHLSTQDVMIQLHELVVKPATRHAPRGILALDLKGAFHNVSHVSMLPNRNKTRCGRKTFGYIKDFLSNRTATIRIGEKSDPVELGDRSTPQASVLSRLLFNLALLPLPDLLKQIEGVYHAFYTDDITVWTAGAGFDAWKEEVLQRAAMTVHEYAKSCGLSSAPQKSGLLMIQPGKSKKKPPPNVINTIDGTTIKPTQQIRILGLLLHSGGKTHAAVTQIKTATEQILSMIPRVSKRNRGLKEDDAMHLVRAFLVSQVTYSASYLQLTKANRDTLNTMLPERGDRGHRLKDSLWKLPQGVISSAAQAILSKRKPPGRAIELVWVRLTRI